MNISRSVRDDGPFLGRPEATMRALGSSSSERKRRGLYVWSGKWVAGSREDDLIESCVGESAFALVRACC